MYRTNYLILFTLVILSFTTFSGSAEQTNNFLLDKDLPVIGTAAKLQTGAEQINQYLPYLKGKRIGMVVNPTSVIGNTTVVDSLLKLGVKIVKIFGPEHGFRGDASAGVKVDDSFDAKNRITGNLLCMGNI